MLDSIAGKAAEIAASAMGGNHSPPCSHDALALLFAEQHAGQLLYVPAWHQWLKWDGGHWAEDRTLAVFDRARAMCRKYASAFDGKDAIRMASKETVAAVESLARSDTRFARTPDQFDADPWALNTPGGVVDLKTGQLRPHQRGDLHTKLAGAAPGGECPRWRQFLREITGGDADLMAYLQRWAGYTLTGDTREHAFLFIWGPGGNGKSLLLNTLGKAMGSYAETAMADVFTATRNEQHPTHLASLRGARMVLVTETEEGRAWAESRIKSLTGGDRIAARVMRGDPFEFKPHFKLWISGNHQPVLKNPDPAMRRRLHLVPLTFVPPKPDKTLDGVLAAELPGILQWAIDGCLTWQRAGLEPPAIVQEAVAEYFEEQDSLAAWIEERTEKAPDVATRSSDLYADWCIFARMRGESERGQKWFSGALQRHAARKRDNKAAQFIGIKLKHPTWGTPAV